MSFIVKLKSDLRFKGFPPDRVPRSSVHVAGGVEDNDLEPGTNLDGNNTNQNFTLRLFTDPGDQSLGGVKPKEYRINDSRFIGNDGSPNLIFELGVDPGDQSLNGKTPPKFEDTSYSKHVDNPTDPSKVLGIGVEIDTVKPRSRTNTALEQIGVLGSRRLEDLALITTKAVNPIESPRFITNQGILAFTQALDASLKASEGSKLSTFGKAALEGGLDIAKTTTGIISSTTVAGTGTHLIFPPAIDNRYLKKSNSSLLSSIITRFTGIGDGSGVNGAGDALATGRISDGVVNSNFVELNNNEVSKVKVDIESTGSNYIESNLIEPGNARIYSISGSVTNGIIPLHPGNVTKPLFAKNEGSDGDEEVKYISSDLSINAKFDSGSLLGTSLAYTEVVNGNGEISFISSITSSYVDSDESTIITSSSLSDKAKFDSESTEFGRLGNTEVSQSGEFIIADSRISSSFVNDHDEPGSITSNTELKGNKEYYTSNLQYTNISSSGFFESRNVTSSFISEDSKIDVTSSLTQKAELDLSKVFTKELAYTQVSQSAKYTEKDVFLSESNEPKKSIGIRTKLVSVGGDRNGSLDITSFETLQVDSFEESSVANDIIPFNVEIYNPNTPEKYSLIKLRAYLDTFSDDFNGTWNSTKYIGRAEELYNYTGFKRDLNFNFKIAALSREELRPLYVKLNKLVGTTAPVYDSEQNFMKGVFVKLTVGDYLSKVPGFFTNINLSWDTSYPWEINLERDSNVLPHVLDIGVGFQPIHNFNPKYDSKYIGRGIEPGRVDFQQRVLQIENDNFPDIDNIPQQFIFNNG